MKRLLVVGGAVVLAVIACFVRMSMLRRFGPDFIGNLTGGHLLATDAARLYDPDAQRAYQQSLTGSTAFFDLYISPPHTAVPFALLAKLPFRAALVTFTALSFGAFASALASSRPLTDDMKTYAAVALAFAASEPLAETIVIGQTSAFMLLVWIAGVRLARSRRDVLAGAVLGLGVMKPQLFLLVPVVLLATRRYRALAAFLASAASLVALGALVAGPHAYAAWLELLRSSSYGAVREANAFHMCSIEALVRAFVPSVRLAVAVHAVASVALVAMLYAFARRAEEKVAWAAAALVTVVVAPHLIVYDAVLLLVPALVLAAEKPARLALGAAFVIAWLTPVIELPLLPIPVLLLAVQRMRR